MHQDNPRLVGAVGQDAAKTCQVQVVQCMEGNIHQGQVWAYGNLPVMRPGAAFDYWVVVEEALLAAAAGEEEVEAEEGCEEDVELVDGS